jgi:uncharacterized membrane protein
MRSWSDIRRTENPDAVGHSGQRRRSSVKLVAAAVGEGAQVVATLPWLCRPPTDFNAYLTNPFLFCGSPSAFAIISRRRFSWAISSSMKCRADFILRSLSMAVSSSISRSHSSRRARSRSQTTSWLLGQGNNPRLTLQPRGQFDISDIDSLQKVISYITKECHSADSLINCYKAPPSKSLM